MGAYDPDIVALRPYTTAALVAIVREGVPQAKAIHQAGVPPQLASKFEGIMLKELAGLSPFNGQRHGLWPAEVEAWKRE